MSEISAESSTRPAEGGSPKEGYDYGTNYLEERKLVGRWPAPWPQIVSLIFLAAIFYISWWIFQDPRGVMRMYTPYVGYMYTRWILIVVIWMVYIFDYYPFKRKWLEETHPALKGLIMTAIMVVILLVLIHGFFFELMGKLSMTYFSVERTMDLGITRFYAKEYACLACLMFAAIASWLSPSWPACFDNRPWHLLKQPSRGVTILVVTFFLSTLIYLCTMHSHMAILYYPWQEYCAVTAPWWFEFAGTVSGNFHVSWIMCCTVVLWIYETIWERWPFSEIKNERLRGYATFFGIVAIAFCCHFGFYFMQELAWGPAIMGDRRLWAPDWRWLHVGEIMVFFLVPAMFITFYCNNWPQKYSKVTNWLIRNGITVVAGIALYAVYYLTAHHFLGVQQEMSHPQQFPMIPTIWFINIMLIHNWFMDNWPGFKKVRKEV
jgi:AAT family amino acid transporter